jgi:voltage-gated sodium channel
MFQILTLEGWPDIMREILKTHPFAWLFFVPFVLIATFAILNLVVAVIVESMQSGVKAVAEEDKKRDEELHEEHEHLEVTLRAIRRDIAALKAGTANGASGRTRRKTLKRAGGKSRR